MLRGFLVAMLFMPLVAHAAPALHTFSNGETADAADVNGNFGALAQAIDEVAVKLSATAPASPKAGTFWFNTTTSVLSLWSGTGWVVIGGNGFWSPSAVHTSVICATPSTTPCRVPASTQHLVVDNAVYGYPTALDLSDITGTINIQVTASGRIWGNGGKGGNPLSANIQGGAGASHLSYGKGAPQNMGGASGTAYGPSDGTATSGGVSTPAYCSTWWGASGGGGGGNASGAGGNQCGCAGGSGANGTIGRGGASGGAACNSSSYPGNPGGYGAGYGGGGGATAGGGGGGGSYGGAGGAGDNFSSGSGGQVGQNAACAIGGRVSTLTVNVFRADGVTPYPARPSGAMNASATIAGYWYNEMSGGTGDGVGLTGGTALPSRWNGNASATAGDTSANAYFGTPTANRGFYCYY